MNIIEKERKMIDEKLVKRHEKAVDEVNDKIGYLDSCIEDLKEAIKRYWDIENEFPAEALNELLKMGLLPGVVIEIPQDKRRWRLNGYTATDYADFSPVPDETGDTHVYYALDKLYKYLDKWHIVKEGE